MPLGAEYIVGVCGGRQARTLQCFVLSLESAYCRTVQSWLTTVWWFGSICSMDKPWNFIPVYFSDLWGTNTTQPPKSQCAHHCQKFPGLHGKNHSAAVNLPSLLVSSHLSMITGPSLKWACSGVWVHSVMMVNCLYALPWSPACRQHPGALSPSENKPN